MKMGQTEGNRALAVLWTIERGGRGHVYVIEKAGCDKTTRYLLSIP